jgi:uncharacterized RDD family membrane protein YckC
MPRELIIRTPENVEITHSLAGIGSRFIAVMIDHVLQVFFMLLISLSVVYAVQGTEGWHQVMDETANLTGWALAALIVSMFLIFWGYFIFFEVLWNGQSPGKRVVQIRVVKDNGQPVDFFSSAVRNIIRIFDMQPGMTYGIGVASMFFSPAYKRIGDYAAGTVVVKEYVEPKPRQPRRERRKRKTQPTENLIEKPAETVPDEEGTIPGVSIEAIRRVSREEYEAARRFLDRRADLDSSVAGALARRIAEPILARLDMTPDDPERYPYVVFLETLAQDYMRQQDLRF